MAHSMTIARALADERIDRYLFTRVRPHEAAAAPRASGPVIALSRQAGIPGREIADRIASALGFHVFDQEIMDAVREDTHLGDRIIEALDAGKRSALDSWIQGFIQYDVRIIDPKSFHHVVSRVIRGISLHGAAVIVGRGSPFVLRGTSAFRVRLIAREGLRAARAALVAGGGVPIPLHEAREEIARLEAERRRFIRKYFRVDPDDPRAFDLVLNLRSLDPGTAAGIVVEAYRRTAASLPPG
jgi:cytidylate kinase